jgi:simple sugar transport system ATP-binding protein
LSSALLKDITKSFGSVRALDAVSLQVRPQTIQAVVGENGAGKTTLMRALYGAVHPDSGEITIDGTVHRFRATREAIAAGIGMVSQHYTVIPELTCLQSLILGAESGPLLRLREAKARAAKLAAKMGFEFDWDAEASTLSPSGAQKLEILKLLWREARILILDEPTAMLSPQDGDLLFESLRGLVAEGRTVVLVTHRLPEVMEHCSHVTVLRGGRLIVEKQVAGTSASELADLIVGEAAPKPQRLAESRPGETLLEVSGLVVLGDRGDEALKGVDLNLRSGEVLGIAGVDGNGQRELFQALMGVRRVRSGTVKLCGEEITSAPTRQRLQRGMRLIPEDRHEEGVIDEWSLLANAALGLHRSPNLASGILVRGPERDAWAERVARRFATKHGGLKQPMRSLSGGNQQRFVAARALESEPRVILAFQPARGLDIKGTADIYGAIRERCAQGAAAVVVSFDLDELLEHCDRVVAMNHGKQAAPGPGQERDRQAIGRLMVGAT